MALLESPAIRHFAVVVVVLLAVAAAASVSAAIGGFCRKWGRCVWAAERRHLCGLLWL